MMFKTLIKTALFLATLCFSLITHAEVIWVDVRSSIEHSIDNIEGDARIPHGDIVEAISELFPDKNTQIHLYCRSGGRAEKAMSALVAAGYINVSNTGGIDDARKERGLSD